MEWTLGRTSDTIIQRIHSPHWESMLYHTPSLLQFLCACKIKSIVTQLTYNLKTMNLEDMVKSILLIVKKPSKQELKCLKI